MQEDEQTTQTVGKMSKDEQTRLHDLLFSSRRSIRYHSRRESWFDSLHRVTSCLTIFMAGTVFFALTPDVPQPRLVTILAILAAVFSTLDLVIGYSRSADLHRALKDQFAALEIALIDVTDSRGLAGVERRRLEIEMKEPAIYRALDVLCHNELCRALGLAGDGERTSSAEDGTYIVPWWQRLTCHLCRWNNGVFLPNKPEPTDMDARQLNTSSRREM